MFPEVNKRQIPTRVEPLAGRELAHMQKDALLIGTTGQIQTLRSRFCTTTNGSASLKLEQQRVADTFPRVPPQRISEKKPRVPCLFSFPELLVHQRYGGLPSPPLILLQKRLTAGIYWCCSLHFLGNEITFPTGCHLRCPLTAWSGLPSLHDYSTPHRSGQVIEHRPQTPEPP